MTFHVNHLPSFHWNNRKKIGCYLLQFFMYHEVSGWKWRKRWKVILLVIMWNIIKHTNDITEKTNTTDDKLTGPDSEGVQGCEGGPALCQNGGTCASFSTSLNKETMGAVVFCRTPCQATNILFLWGSLYSHVLYCLNCPNWFFVKSWIQTWFFFIFLSENGILHFLQIFSKGASLHEMSDNILGKIRKKCGICCNYPNYHIYLIRWTNLSK